ncbi:MAG: enoyl-CoA hydratase/isomerase family protein [Phycisphaerales bacterium]|nr:enoyl-CoA hydratase/isomerase family protein [Phycisphaerales bacterium]
MTNLAELSVQGAVARLILNRPDQRNALSTDLLAAMHGAVELLEQSRGVTVLVVTGAGKSFCAGMDLRQVLIGDDRATWPGPQLLESLARFTVRLRGLPMVVVASVNGAAIGGGCGLACVADVCVSHADARIGYPEVDLGLCPAVVAPWVIRKVGPGKARRVLLAGGVMTGTEAHALGLVDHLAASVDELAPLTERLVGRLTSGGPTALRATKSLLNALDGSLDEASVLEGARLSAEVLGSPDAQRALSARRT